MSPYRRNVFVGATVVVALAILAWMILKFAGKSAVFFAPATFNVHFVAARADGVGDGAPITFRGIEMGHVTRVWLDETTRDRVYFEGQVNTEPPLPAHLTAKIRAASALGSGSLIALEATVDSKPGETLKADTEIPAVYVGLGEFLPTQEISELAIQLTGITKQLRESNLIGHIDEQVKHAGDAIEAIQSLVTDDGLRKDVKDSLENIRESSEHAKAITAKLDAFAIDLQTATTKASATMDETRTQIARAGNNIDTLTKQLGDRLTQTAGLLVQIQSISEKINNGKGTAGQLVNDPRLYETLVDTSKELNATIKDLKRLVEQWEQEGVGLKLR